MSTTMTFDGLYEVKEEIGKGGMSVVYLAEHKRLHTYVAIKEVRKQQCDKFNFLAETNILKRLHHPKLPQIMDIFEDEECVYIVEEYVEGVTLEEWMKQHGRVEESQGRQWFQELASVLQYLHEQQPNPIIYRDMKPSNIMLQTDGSLKLIDFGIAREYKRGSRGDTAYIGTREYAAPEQLGGTTQTDARTDIYSLGVTMYHLFTGKAPYEPPYGFVPVRQLVPGLSRGIEKILTNCIQPDPKDRYQTAAKLLDDLEHSSRVSTVRKKPKSDAWRWAALVAAGLAVVIGVIVGIRALIGRADTTLPDDSGKLSENQENTVAAIKVESRITQDAIREDTGAVSLQYTLSYPSAPKLEQVDAYYIEQEQKRLKEVEQYQAEMYEMEYNTLVNDPTYMPYTFKTNYEVLRNDGILLSILRTDENYTGGAHGACSYASETFLVQEQRLLTLDELFAVSSEEYLPRILSDLVQKIDKEADNDTALNHYSSWEALAAVFNVEQFALDDDEFVFFFQEYEIGSYAAGAPSFRLAISDYLDILNSEWFPEAEGTLRENRSLEISGDLKNAVAPIKVESRITQDMIREDVTSKDSEVLQEYTLSYPSMPELKLIDAYYVAQEKLRLTEIEKGTQKAREQYLYDPVFMEFEYGTEYEVLRNDGVLLSILRTEYTYEGGTRGSYFLTSETFLVKEQRLLTLDDLFTVPREEYLPRILSELLPMVEKEEQNNHAFFVLEDLTDGFDFDNEQFAVDNDTLVFFVTNEVLEYGEEGVPTFRLDISDYLDILNREWFPAAESTLRENGK